MRTIRGSTLEPSGKLFVKDLSLYFPKQKRVGGVHQANVVDYDDQKVRSFGSTSVSKGN